MTGPVILREKPQADLIDRQAYQLPGDVTRADYEACADWVRFHGGEVPYLDDHGMLVVSIYPTDDEHDGDRYYEWVGGSTLLVFNAEHHEFSAYGYTMRDHYFVDPWTGKSDQ